MLAEVSFERGAVPDFWAVSVFEIGQFADKCLFEFLFSHLSTLRGLKGFGTCREFLNARRQAAEGTAAFQKTSARAASILFVSVVVIRSLS